MNISVHSYLRCMFLDIVHIKYNFICTEIISYNFNINHQEEKERIEKNREKEILEVEAIKAAIEKANQRILLYGNEVLEESKGVRPLYPIVKVIEVNI